MLPFPGLSGPLALSAVSGWLYTMMTEDPGSIYLYEH